MRRELSIALGYGVVLAVVNIAICLPLFGLEFSRHLQTNEGFFIATSRILAEHPSETLWWPFVDSGIPFQNTYLPLLQALVAIYSKLAHCSVAAAFHTISAIFYCLGPVSAFAMAAALSRRIGVSFLAALAYSVISPSSILSPVIRNDGGWDNLRRFHVVAYYGEVPHTVALAILPLAILFIYLCWTRPGFGWKIAAGVAIAAVALTNFLGIMTLAIGAVCLLLTIGSTRLWRNLATLSAVGIAAYFWISPYLPPSALWTTLTNSPRVSNDFTWHARSLVVAAVLLCGAAVLEWISRRCSVAPHVRFFALWAFVLAGVALAGIELGVFLLPQPQRYHIEMDLAVCLAVVFVAASALDRLPKFVRALTIALVLAILLRQSGHARSFARSLVGPIDITATGAYKMARWLDQNRKGQRAMIAGSDCFLYNIFTDNPQMDCGFEPTNPNFVNRFAVFTIYTGMNAGPRDTEISVMWLKAFGAQALTVPAATGPGDEKLFANPRKFDGVLPILWRAGGDTIYEVPNRSTSLAHVIPRSAVVWRAPVHGLDVEPLAPYLAALDDPSLPVAELQWHDLHSAKISAEVRRDQVVSVQTNFATGWHATAGGTPCGISRDAIGLLLIEPPCDGRCEIEFAYDGGAELRIARWLSWSALAIGLVGWIAARRQARSKTVT